MAKGYKYLSFAFGEMTISLDDVSCLLHTPIIGQFPTASNVSFGDADLLFELLGVESSNGKAEMRHLKCRHVHLSWLRDVYE